MTTQTWEQKVDEAMARLIAGDDSAEKELERLATMAASLAWLGMREEALSEDGKVAA